MDIRFDMNGSKVLGASVKRALTVLVASLAIGQSANAQWVQTTSPAGGRIASLDAFRNHLFACTQFGGVFASTDNGTTWTLRTSGLPFVWFSSLVNIDTNLFVSDGVIFRSSDNGLTWTHFKDSVTPATSIPLVVSGSNLYAEIYGPGVCLSTDEGVSWTSLNEGSQGVWSLAANGSNVIDGQTNEVRISTNSGSSWVSVDSGLGSAGRVISLAVSGTSIYAGTDTGGVYFSNDTGTSWKPSGLIEWANVIEVIGPIVFVGTNGHGVYLSTDNGSSWNSISAGLTNLFVYCFAVNDSNIFAGTDGGGVFVAPLASFGIALPIQLNRFVATARSEGGILLEWSTESEVNNYGFSVWRSGSSNTGFHRISSVVAGHGTTLSPHQYSWTDTSQLAGEPYYRLRQINLDGSYKDYDAIRVAFTQGGAADGTIPKKFTLNQNYPNPFNPSTQITFSITKEGPVSLRIYDVLGRNVSTLVNENRKPGQYSESFNGNQMASGVYVYVLRSSEGQLVGRMMMLK